MTKLMMAIDSFLCKIFLLSIITNECLYLNLSDLVLNLFWGLRCRSARDFVEPKFDRRELSAIENELKNKIIWSIHLSNNNIICSSTEIISI